MKYCIDRLVPEMPSIVTFSSIGLQTDNVQSTRRGLIEADRRRARFGGDKLIDLWLAR